MAIWAARDGTAMLVTIAASSGLTISSVTKKLIAMISDWSICTLEDTSRCGTLFAICWTSRILS